MTLVSLIKKGSPLSTSFFNFEQREGQQQLSFAVESAIESKHHLIAEAGTGVGKTLAYLLPCLQHNKKLLVSTATKHLQDQLFFKDIPLAEKLLEKTFSVCLLKGRNNYFCHHRYYELLTANTPLSFSDKKQLSQVESWILSTDSGDLNELGDFDSTFPDLKKKITSTTENCLGSDCKYYKDCFTQKVRERAKSSQVVITNHSLLMADVLLKETGFAEILPDSEVIVIDEAHQLPAKVFQAYSTHLSSNRLLELITDLTSICKENQIEIGVIGENLKESIKVFVTCLNKSSSSQKVSLSELKKLAAYKDFQKMMVDYGQLITFVQQQDDISDELMKIKSRVEEIAEAIKTIFIPDHTTTGIAILEWSSYFFSASKIPMTLEEEFTSCLDRYADSWVFVSATLKNNGSFDAFKQQLGLSQDLPSLSVDSPFDYSSQSVTHIMEDIVYPNHPDFFNQFLVYSESIIQHMQGRTFLLFTSYKGLEEAKQFFSFSDIDVLVQGDLPKAQLIKKFINSNKAILLGTMSFWEGVDVVGDKLSCVIIDKIPFPSPGDPVISEQMRYMERNQQNGFEHIFLPKAEMYLKQGYGRLIRHKTDKGVVILGDRRLKDKAYGKQLIASLPTGRILDKAALFDWINTLDYLSQTGSPNSINN